LVALLLGQAGEQLIFGLALSLRGGGEAALASRAVAAHDVMLLRPGLSGAKSYGLASSVDVPGTLPRETSLRSAPGLCLRYPSRKAFVTASTIPSWGCSVE